MLFSFVIPTYNRSKKVRRAIDSILMQPNWSALSEIIVVDDGSTDNTEVVLYKYLVRNQIKLIKHCNNEGVAMAKNTGIQNASNDYVVLLDSDDELEKNGLNYLKKIVLSHDHDLFFCGTKIMNSQRLMYDPKFSGIKTYYDLLKTPVGEYLPVGKTEVLKKNPLSNLRGYESITWLNLAKKGYSLYFDQEPIRLYDINGDDRISNRFNGLKNSGKMRDGYIFYLKEFGTDLKTYNYREYLKIKIKLICCYLCSFIF